MLPSFLSLNGGVAGAPVEVPPPHGFREAGKVLCAGWDSRNLDKPQGSTAAQKAGLRYERKVHIAMQDGPLASSYYIEAPLFFVSTRGRQNCYPDALVLHPLYVGCIEIKSQHMPESWWQLRKKYEPVLRMIYPASRIVLLEICGSYDPSMPYPEAVTLVEDIASWFEKAKDGELGVFQWKL